MDLVAVTAMSNDGSRDRTRAAGFDLHLVKPVDPHLLVAKIHAFGRTAAEPSASR